MRGGCTAAGGRARRAGGRGAGTHSNERKGAARVDIDAMGGIEATEGGGRPGGDVNMAEPVVALVLRCITITSTR